MKRNSSLSSNRLPVARPWTPPETDTEVDSQSHWMLDDVDEQTAPQADSGYFGEANSMPSLASQDIDNVWHPSASLSPNLSSTPTKKKASRLDHMDNGHESRVQGLGIQPRPYTPTKASSYSDAPQYPYTPDSARTSIQRSQTYHITSPLPSMPWDSSPPPLNRTHTSPVQNALFSCLNNLEHLIQSSQPTDDQMEYIISQFEAMTSYLSAPEAQSKQSDDHLFSEQESSTKGDKSQTISKAEADAYVAEVGRFIEGVRAYAGDMNARLREVKELNEINLDIIADLQKELKKRGENPPKEQGKQKYSIVKLQRVGFWGAVGEALDAVGEMLHEW